jgi:hypothetical protein
MHGKLYGMLLNAAVICAAPAAALETPWGEPDLQGIWTSEFDTPLQRPTKYVDQEFFTEAQRAELDKERAMLVERRRERRTGVGDADVTGRLLLNPTGARTSLIVDPPDGRIPTLTPQAQQAAAADREFRLALLQATETCKNKLAACAGGRYDPIPSPRRAEPTRITGFITSRAASKETTAFRGCWGELARKSLPLRRDEGGPIRQRGTIMARGALCPIL